MRLRTLLHSLFFASTLIFATSCGGDRPPADLPDTRAAARLTANHAVGTPSPVRPLLAAAVDSALALQKGRRYQEALDLLEQAIQDDSLQSPSPADTVLALAWHKMGVSRYGLDQYEGAVACFERALRIREAVLPPDHPDIIRGYNNIGNVYLLLNDRDKALDFLLRSLALQPEPPVDPYPATIRALGRIYEDMNDAYRAGKYLNLALEAYQRFYPDAPWEIAGAYTDLAHFHLHQENYEASLQASRHALNIRMGFEHKYREDSTGIAVAFTNISLAHEKLGRLDSAMLYQMKSLQWNQRLYNPNEPILAKNHNNLGYLHLSQQDFQAAAAELNQAIRLNTQNGDYVHLSDNLENLGLLHFQKKDYDEALTLYQRALTRLVPALDGSENIKIPAVDEVKIEPLKVMRNLYLKGEALSAQFEQNGQVDRLQLALQHFDRLSQLVDRLRFSYLMDDSKVNLARQVKPFFQEAIAVALRLQEETGDRTYAERAFDFAEKSKAIVLLEALKESRARQFAGLEEADLERERELKQRIAQLETDIYLAQQQIEPNAGQLQEWKRTLIDAYQTYEQFVAALEKKSPEYYRLKYENRTLSVREIQGHPQLLAPDQAMVEFFVGEDRLYAFRISRRDFRVYELPLDFDLTASVDHFRQSINGFLQDPDKTLPAYASLGDELHRRLWAPLSAELPQRLILIPDDVLGLLPFEALLSQPADTGRPLKEWPYLIKKHQISYAYSATLLHETLERPAGRRITDEILAFAPSFEQKVRTPPASNPSNPIADNAHAVDTRRGLQPLFFNEQEVESIGEIAAAQIIAGPAANKKKFRELAPRYRFLHIATHGLADDEEPDYSFVAFSQPADTIVLDEVLLVRELYNLQLNAEMVVLSACETGVGKIRRGEGIVSLARGFSYAGARSIVTTLWNISDQRSNDLMRAFYEQLRDGKSKDSALRTAKMRFVGQSGNLAHPYFWAGFIPLGDMSAVDLRLPKDGGRLPAAPLAFLAITMVAGIWFWKGRKGENPL